MAIEVNKKQGKSLIIAGGSLLVIVAAVVVANRLRAKSIYNAINKILDADPNSVASTSVINAAAKLGLDPTYFKTQGYIDNGLQLVNNTTFNTVFMRSTAKSIADNIYGAWHVLWANDDSKIISQLTAIPSKVVMSYVAYVFQLTYGQNLTDFLNNHFGELATQVNAIIAALK